MSIRRELPPLPTSPGYLTEASGEDRISDSFSAISDGPVLKPGSDTSEGDDDIDHHVKVVCVGDGGCGKTCMMVTYAQGYFPETYIPTVFENYINRVQTKQGKTVELALWDTAGQEEYDRLRALSYPEVDVLLICYGIDAPASLQNVYDKWLPEVAHYCADVPIILVGLKKDLRNDPETAAYLAAKGQKILSISDGERAAKRIKAAKFMECSARTREGVDNIFMTAIDLVIQPPSPPSPQRIARKPVNSKSTKPSSYKSVRHYSYPDLTNEDTHRRSRKKSRKCIVI